MTLPEKFTKQSLIEYVIPLLHKQGVRSVYVGRNSVTSCRYNGPDGHHCAIGWVIPPELYRKEWDIGNEQGIMASAVQPHIPNIKDLAPHFIMSLQTLHDNPGIPSSVAPFKTERFKRAVERFCVMWQLSYHFLDNLEWKE